MFNKLSLNSRLLILAVIALIIFIAFYRWCESLYHEDLDKLAKQRLEITELSFNKLLQRDVDLLSAVANTVLKDKEIIDHFKSRNRDELFKSTESIFSSFNEQYGISLFYFHLPNGITFLKVHDKEHFGGRHAGLIFNSARSVKETLSGIDVDNGTIALKTVVPVVIDEELIGYLELGQSVHHFIETLQAGTKNRYAIFVEKKYLTNKDKKSLPLPYGTGSNLGFKVNHVLITHTGQDLSEFTSCINILSYNNYESKVTYAMHDIHDASFACGILPLKMNFTDTRETIDHIGEIITIFDISTEADIAMSAHRNMIFFILSMLVFVFVSLFIIKLSISSPIKNILKVTKKISGGDFTSRLNIGTKDDFGLLSHSINEMASQLDIFYKDMEALVNQRTLDVVHINNALETANDKLTTSYKMLETQTQELKAVNLELTDLDKLKTEFLQTISHELRSPLTPILGYLEIMQDGDLGELTDLQKDIVHEMFICGKNLQMVLDELLEAATIQAGKLFMEFNEIDLDTLLKTCIKDIRRYTENHNIEISLSNISPPILIKADSSKLKQIFSHLLRNAVKFNKPNGTISVNATVHDGHVAIDVTDTGIGIPENKLKNIFDGFYQVDSSAARHYEGVGLGLYLVHKLIDLHNGSIDVKSEWGKGTTFTVTLPKI